jgi:hypothetical protein
VSITDLLLLALVAGAALQWRRHREERPVPRPLLAVSALVAAAIVFGVVVGLGNGGWVVALLNHVRPPVYLAVVPIAAVLVLRSDGATRRVLVVALVLASVKAIEGVVLGVQYAFRGGQTRHPSSTTPPRTGCSSSSSSDRRGGARPWQAGAGRAAGRAAPRDGGAPAVAGGGGFWIALAVALLVVLSPRPGATPRVRPPPR